MTDQILAALEESGHEVTKVNRNHRDRASGFVRDFIHVAASSGYIQIEVVRGTKGTRVRLSGVGAYSGPNQPPPAYEVRAVRYALQKGGIETSNY